jgi:hypothetical protein
VAQQGQGLAQTGEQLHCGRDGTRSHRVLHPIPTRNCPPQKGIVVVHYANKGMVNGPAIDTAEDTFSREALNFPSLLAFPAPVARGDKPTTASSKLKVGPGVLETAYRNGVMRRAYANYWVVAAGVCVCLGGWVCVWAPGSSQ